MKESAMVLAIILLLPFLGLSLQAVKAQVSFIYNDGMRIYSPGNRTYAPNDIIAIRTQLDIRYGAKMVLSGNFTLDNGDPQNFSQDALRTTFWSVTYGGLCANVTLPKLSEGQHKLTVYLRLEYPGSNPPNVIDGEATVYFSIATAEDAQNLPTYGDAATIYSPCNRTYDRNEVIVVNASASAFTGQNVTYLGTYSIDGHGSYPLKKAQILQTNNWPYAAVVETAELPSLAEGQHKLTVYIESYTGYPKGSTMSGKATVYFTIGDLNSPNITLGALDGVVFNQTSIPLNFTINEPTLWSAYCLDNGTQTTIATNTTLTVSAGNHTLIVYANDTAGNLGQSEIAHFAVQAPALPQTDVVVQVAIVIASIVAIAVLLVIWRTRKPLNRPGVRRQPVVPTLEHFVP